MRSWRNISSELDSMKTKLTVLTLLLASRLNILCAAPLGTAFPYQGQLQTNGIAVNQPYDFQFTLYDAATTNGNIVAVAGGYNNPTNLINVAVSNGLFTVLLDFGPRAFTGNARWVAISATPSPGGGSFPPPLSPLQPLTPSPGALYALTASNLSGTLPLTQLPG